MDNLRGVYAAKDGRAISIERVGADKITHRNIEIKLRVSPELGEFIKNGELLGVVDVNHNKFIKMAYYRVHFVIGQDLYDGTLNIGIKKNGDSTLYDLNPFNKK